MDKIAFPKLKLLLSNPQILSPYDPTLELYLDTEASQTGFEGVLYQMTADNK